MKTYQCPSCAARVFFENLSCVACGCEFGYAPTENKMLALTNAAAAGQWRACGNRTNSAACNWLVAPQQTAMSIDLQPVCDCCRYTKTIPPLNDFSLQQAWRRLEQAKRYLYYSLLTLQLPIPDREQQPENGLAFEFLAELPEQHTVMTGYAAGIITINVAEADDVKREQRRVSLHEPYRTLLGHLRHEIGHFYWQQLIANSGEQLAHFRAVFGDERQDYAAALQQHYQSVDEGSWQARHISHYASAHPWEDWAETWAHYLHISDALDTARDWRVQIETTDLHIKPVGISKTTTDVDFKARLITEWLPLSQYLNATCRSLGESDPYPFILSPAVIDKLTFIHATVRAA